MAGKEKELVGQLGQLSVQPRTPSLTMSPNSPAPSQKPSFHETTPSVIDIILAELRNRHKGQPQQESEWWCLQLSLDEFESLEERIQADEDLYGFIGDKAKYDYFPQFSQFVLRMAGDLHEFVLGGVEEAILVQLFAIRQGDNQAAADFARSVRPMRSPKVVLKHGERHCPDGSFGHKAAPYPCLVIEISHSQKRKDLPFLADDYLLGSHGRVQIVIGIDLEYEKEKGLEAKVLVWQPRLVERDETIALEASQTFEGIFRAQSGSLVNGDQVLRIQLKDFGDKIAYPGIEHVSGEIAIAFSQLYDIVRAGNEREQTVAQNLQSSEINPPDMPMR